MASTLEKNKSYIELAQNDFKQTAIFIVLALVLFVVFFKLETPFLEYFFKSFLNGQVYNETGKVLSYSLDEAFPKKSVDYVFAWAVDVYKGTSQETRYWFNPFLSTFLQTAVFAFVFAAVFTAVLPRKWGYLRQKIDRETMNAIAKISYAVYGEQSEALQNEILEKIYSSDIKNLFALSDEWGIPVEDLVYLQKTVRWRETPFLRRLLKVNNGLQSYMRFYFTVRYANYVLGSVYLGASILIIIVGLRGLKFVPPTQPSLVLFALGLEFTLLVVYAVTIMYSKSEAENEIISKAPKNGETGASALSNKNVKELEKLLRVFISGDKKL